MQQAGLHFDSSVIAAFMLLMQCKNMQEPPKHPRAAVGFLKGKEVPRSSTRGGKVVSGQALRLMLDMQ